MSITERTRNIWRCMKKRCLDPNDPRYADYGGRGITVDPAWWIFDVFLRDMGIAPPGLQIDRLDNNKGYCKDNCHWASRKQQQNNTRVNRWIEHAGRKQTLSQWADELGIDASTLFYRLKRMDVANALTAGRVTYARRDGATPTACQWCGYLRMPTENQFCSRCRKNVDGETYDVVRARTPQELVRKKREPEPWEIEKFQGVVRVCPRCKIAKSVLDGFGIQRKSNKCKDGTKSTYTSPLTTCRECCNTEAKVRRAKRWEE